MASMNNTSVSSIESNSNGVRSSAAAYKPAYYSISGLKEAESRDRILIDMNDGYNGNLAWSNFDRWYSVDLSKEGGSGRHYIFICRPDLNLLDQADLKSKKLNPKNGVSEDPYFQYLGAYYPDIISSLTAEFNIPSNDSRKSLGSSFAGSGYGNSLYNVTEGGKSDLPIHAFIPFLTSRAESLQLPDYAIKTDELRQPYTRYGIPYASSAIESMTGGDFDITFRDDRFFSIRKLFYAWVYYMDGVMRDKFTPKDKYITYNCFDYATSIYDFLVDETGETIIWWTKYTGCFPYQVPISDLSFNRGSDPNTSCTISFKYFICEPPSLATLIDFNYNSLGYRQMRQSDNESKTLAQSTSGLVFAKASNENVLTYGSFLGQNYVGRPCVTIDTNANDSKYKLSLKWLAKT